MAKVSVITPVFRAEKYVERCARSLMEQTLNDMEFIFIDDCGGDESMNIVKRVVLEYPERKSHVKILYNEKNMGSASTRNRGLDVATGDYITFLDADDWFDKDGLDRMYNFMTTNNLEIGYSGSILENEGGRHVAYMQPAFFDLKQTRRAMVKCKISTQPCNKMFKLALLERTGERFVDGADMAEDKSLNIRLFLQADRIACLNDEPYYHYNIDNSESISHFKDNTYKLVRNFEASNKNLQAVLKTIERLQLQEIYHEEIIMLKLATKSYLVKGRYDKALINRWVNMYPECNSRKYIFNQEGPRSMKVAEWLLAHRFIFFYRWITRYKPIV